MFTGLSHVQAEALGDGAGDHGRCCGGYLTGIHVKKTEGADITSGVSMDQMVAKQFGDQTQIPSLEIGLEPPSLVGSCDSGYSCAYTNTLSWSSPSTPLPVTINPREVFERMFGDGDSLDAKSRLAQLRRQASILDFVAADAKRMSGKLGASDKQKLDEYLEAVRDIEKRIQKVEKGGTGAVALPAYSKPSGVPDAFEDYAHMMIDLQVLAMQADMTRVATFMIGREVSGRSYPEIGVPDAHHPLSHHGNDPEKIAKLTKINTLHMEQVAYYLKRMSETKDGDKPLIDSHHAAGGRQPGRSQPSRPSRPAGDRGRRPDQGQPPCHRRQGHPHDQHDAGHDGHPRRAGRQARRLHRPPLKLRRLRTTTKTCGRHLYWGCSGALAVAGPAMAGGAEDRCCRRSRPTIMTTIKSAAGRACRCECAAAGQVHGAGLGGGPPG